MRLSTQARAFARRACAFFRGPTAAASPATDDDLDLPLDDTWAPSPAWPLTYCPPQFVATPAAVEAAGAVQVTGHRVFLVEIPGHRPCYCVQDGAGPDFESAVPQ
jgi:hypothetical protein